MNAELFQQKILCYSDALFRMAKSILRDEVASQDVCQDTLLKLWEKRDILDSVTNYKSFSLSAVRNQCIDALRKTRETEDISQKTVIVELDPYRQIEETDTVNRIKKLIDDLPELQRTIVRLRDVEEMEIEEIAQITGLTENAISVNLSRARKKLREQILQQQALEKQRYERYR